MNKDSKSRNQQLDHKVCYSSPITEMLVLLICLAGSPFSSSHTYTPLSSAVTLSIVRLLLESSSQLSHAVATEFVIEILELWIWMKKFKLVSSVPFLFSHMILGAGNPVASQIIVTVADSLTMPPPKIIAELGSSGEDRLYQVKIKKTTGTFTNVHTLCNPR